MSNSAGSMERMYGLKVEENFLVDNFLVDNCRTVHSGQK